MHDATCDAAASRSSTKFSMRMGTAVCGTRGGKYKVRVIDLKSCFERFFAVGSTTCTIFKDFILKLILKLILKRVFKIVFEDSCVILILRL